MTKHPLPRRSVLAAGVAATALSARGAHAAFPERPIRWIVAYPPGGGNDTLARLVGGMLAERLGQPVVIENRTGAGGNIGAEAAAKAPPDGYTLFTADNGHLIFNPVLYRRLPYDAVRDFQPVGLLGRFDLVLAVRRDSALRTARDYVERARQAPGALDYGTPGIGQPHHMAMERLAREAGVRVNHIPYRGAQPAMSDLLAGNLESAVLAYSTSLELLRSGGLRPLAVCSAARLPGLPDVPTVEEALGLRGYECSAWQGLMVPARTPEPVVARLSQELRALLADEGARARVRQAGVEPLGGGPQEFERRLSAERAVWVPLLQSLNIALD